MGDIVIVYFLFHHNIRRHFLRKKFTKPISEITWAGSGFTEVMEGGGVGEGEGVLCDLLDPDLCGE